MTGCRCTIALHRLADVLLYALQLTYYEFAKEELEQLDNGMSASSMTTSSSDSADDSRQGITDEHPGQDQRSGECTVITLCVSDCMYLALGL